MNMQDIRNKKDKLALIFKLVKENLESRKDWQAYMGDGWVLQQVGILNDGEIIAVVRWGIGYTDKEQQIVICWAIIEKL